MVAIKAKHDADAMWQVKAACSEIIESAFESIWYKVRHIDRAHESLDLAVENAVHTFDASKSSFKTYAINALNRECARIVSRDTRLSRSFCFEDIDDLNLAEDHDIIEDVELIVDVRDRITRLATCNPKKNFIINAWREGCYKVSDLAHRMSGLFGGNPESNRKFITRFKNELKTALYGVI